MVLVGRLTKNATTSTLKDGRSVVNFTIALNDYFKSKGEERGKRVTTFVECAYWISKKASELLVKGALIEVNGRIYASAYIAKSGEPKGVLHCHINSFTIHQRDKNDAQSQKSEATVVETGGNLPF